jgi:hypothetical protein
MSDIDQVTFSWDGSNKNPSVFVLYGVNKEFLLSRDTFSTKSKHVRKTLPIHDMCTLYKRSLHHHHPFQM